jgi:UDP:flavonoid glycosyltransferase YjiC (YdhE family)
MPEQLMTAQRIQELGLGTVLDEKTLTVEKLQATIRAAITNPDYRRNAAVMQQHVRKAGGYKRAADAIQHFTQSQGRITEQA